MVSLEDSNQNRTWWYNQLKLSDDWNSMTVEMRGDLVKRLQRALVDLTQLSISKEEMLELVHTYDQATVWDAILALQDLPNKSGKSKWELMAYLKKTASGMWKDQHPSKPLVWQIVPKDEKKRKPKTASWDCVEKNDPLSRGARRRKGNGNN